MFSNVNSIEKFEKVKLPQIETISRFYQPRKNRKAIRILTVAIYVLCVSLAAIMLSLYYVFLWDPTLKPNISKSTTCEKIPIPEQIAIRLINSTETTADQFYKNLLQHYRIRQNYQRRKYHPRQMRVRINNNNNYKFTSVQPEQQRIIHTSELNLKQKSSDIIIPSTIITTVRNSTIYPIVTNFKKISNNIINFQRDDEQDDYMENNLESSGSRALI